jgi:hypothetical protein
MDNVKLLVQSLANRNETCTIKPYRGYPVGGKPTAYQRDIDARTGKGFIEYERSQ